MIDFVALEQKVSYVTMISLLFDIIQLICYNIIGSDNSSISNQLVLVYHCIQLYISKNSKGSYCILSTSYSTHIFVTSIITNFGSCCYLVYLWYNNGRNIYLWYNDGIESMNTVLSELEYLQVVLISF